jgi:hypothetical protein
MDQRQPQAADLSNNKENKQYLRGILSNLGNLGKFARAHGRKQFMQPPTFI